MVHFDTVWTKNSIDPDAKIPFWHRQQGQLRTSSVTANVDSNTPRHKSMALEPFSGWQPLTVGQIRLLKLNRNDNDKTSFDLEVHDIDRAPAFAALSYVCGSEAPSCTFTLNIPKDSAAVQPFEKRAWSISITPNLKTTLVQLSTFSRIKKSFLGFSREKRGFLGHDYLWIDAICINQIDLEEKSAQVSSMHKIYTAAQEVLICLGQEQDSSSAIIAVLKKVAGLIGHVDHRPVGTEFAAEDIISEDNVRALAMILEDSGSVYELDALQDLGLPVAHHVFWQGLKRLFYREWFWRLWTFQEAVLAQRGYVVCGDQGIQWDQLLAIAKPLIATGLIYVSPSRVNVPKGRSGSSIPSPPILDFQSMLGSTGRAYCWRVNAARRREVSEPRDKVYAILSLAPPDLRQSIDVDYTIPLPRLYTALTRALIRSNTHNLYIVFVMVDSVDRLPGLPTWCPDYGQLNHPGIFTSFPLSATLTSGSSLRSEEAIFEPALRVEGAKFDTVQAAVPAFEMKLGAKSWGVVGNAAPYDVYALMLEWLEACWSLIQEQRVGEAEYLFARFTSIILAEGAIGAPYPDNAVEGLRALWRILDTVILNDGPAELKPSHQWGLFRPVLSRLHGVWRNHIFFSTVHGDFGIATHRAQVGDKLCIFFDDGRKYLLRPSEQAYEFVSNAYVGSVSGVNDAVIAESGLIKEVFTII